MIFDETELRILKILVYQNRAKTMNEIIEKIRHCDGKTAQNTIIAKKTVRNKKYHALEMKITRTLDEMIDKGIVRKEDTYPKAYSFPETMKEPIRAIIIQIEKINKVIERLKRDR